MGISVSRLAPEVRLGGGVLTKIGDLARQVDAVDENIAVGDLLCVVRQLGELLDGSSLPTEGPALGSLCHIPLDDVLLGHAGLAQGVNGA